MPIVKEYSSGLRRFAVFSFAEDLDQKNNNTPVKEFPNCPLTSASEAATKLPHTELFHMKRLKSIEKKVLYPFVDVTFFSSYESVQAVTKLVGKTDCVNLYNPSIQLQKAVYEELQLVDPKRDMIQTPIDASDPIEEFRTGTVSQRAKQDQEYEDDNKKLRGYVVIAYKTMEDMYNREFVGCWKTWTGVRYICMQLPRQLGLRRISFYRQLTNTSVFTYVLLIEISNLLVYAAQTLNLMDGIKLRLCGYVGIYRESDFKLDPVTAANLNLETDYQAPTGRSSKSRASKQDSKEPPAASSQSEEQAASPVPASESPPQPSPKKATGKVRKPSQKEPSGAKDKEKKKEAVPIVQSPPPKEKKATEEKKVLTQASLEKEQAPTPKPRAAPAPLPSRQESVQSIQSQDTDRYSLTSVEITTPTIPARPAKLKGETELKSQTPERETPRLVSSPQLAKVLEEPKQQQAVEAVVHARPVRFAGQGRISQSGGSALYPTSSTTSGQSIRRPLIPEDDEEKDAASRKSSTTSEASNLSQLRRQSLLSSTMQHRPSSKKDNDNANVPGIPPRHNVVSDLPSAREMLKPAYESIFKRMTNPVTEGYAVPPDFSTIAARYNSPVFTRAEWRKESGLFGNDNANAGQPINPNQNLDNLKETAILENAGNQRQQQQLHHHHHQHVALDEQNNPASRQLQSEEDDRSRNRGFTQQQQQQQQQQRENRLNDNYGFRQLQVMPDYAGRSLSDLRSTDDLYAGELREYDPRYFYTCKSASAYYAVEVR